MDKIEEVVLNSILSENGLNKEEFDIHSSFHENGLESIDMVETLIDIEEELTIQGLNVVLNYYEMNVYEDNFYTLMMLIRSKL